MARGAALRVSLGVLRRRARRCARSLCERFAQLRTDRQRESRGLETPKAGDWPRPFACNAVGVVYSAILEHHSGLLESISEVQASNGARLNVIDGRLAIIEKRIGLVQA
jgi:hypothetical protein